jgi:hypothetical protein
MHLLGKTCVGHDEPPVVEDRVADQSVEERLDLLAEPARLRLELRQGLREAVRDLDVATPERSQQLLLVVPGHAQCGTGGGHRHRGAQNRRRIRAPINEIAEEDDHPVLRVPRHAVIAGRVPERGEQLAKFRDAPVDVADQVERPVQVGTVRPSALAHDLDAVDLVRPAENEDAAEPLALEVLHRPTQQPRLAPHDMRAEGSIRTLGVPSLRDLVRDVEHDRDGQHMVVAREPDQGLACIGLDVGRVDDRQPPQRQPGAGDRVQGPEGFPRDGLVIRVVGHHRAEGVRRQHFRREEMLRGERRLPRPADTDEDDERELRDRDRRHRSNTATWVGGPTWGSTVPTGRKRTP